MTKNSLNQYGNINSNGISNNVSLNIHRQISKKIVGIINYTFSQNGDVYNKDVFNFNNISGKHDMLDSIYSIHNRNTGISHQPAASIGYKGDKFSAELGAGIRFGNLLRRMLHQDYR
jgi:hypothetical protein